jgi:tetratricopeptide (TPR) repeat protein
VGLFDVFKAKKTAEKPVAIEARTPLEIAREVERFIESREYKAALEVAEKGVYENPRSEIVLGAYRFLKKETLGDDLKRLRQKLDKEPNPISYSQLADAYKEIGDHDKAIDLCRKAIDLFPDHEGPWIILGRTRLDRFREDWIPRDALLAVEYYEKALDLNRNSYKTLIDLAELYTEIGAKRRSVKKCEAILYFAPEDEKALSLLRKAQSMPDQKREDLDELVAQYAEKKRKAAQRRGRKANEPHGPAGRLAKSPALLQKKLETLKATIEGFYAAVATDLEGNAIASNAARAIDQAAISGAVGQVFEAASDCSLRIDIGHFKRGVFEGPSGFIYLVVFDEIRIAILCDPGTKMVALDEAVTRFVEDELYR